MVDMCVIVVDRMFDYESRAEEILIVFFYACLDRVIRECTEIRRSPTRV